MTAEELEAIQSRADAATPGPWGVFANGKGQHEFFRSETGIRLTSPHDMNFMAFAREDIPRLLAEVRWLQDRLAGVRSGIERWKGEGANDETNEGWLLNHIDKIISKASHD